MVLLNESYAPSYVSNGIPVFKPTYEEFINFEKYITSIETYGIASGIVKVIPPEEWKSHLPNYSKYIDLKMPLNKDACPLNEKENPNFLFSRVVISKPIQQIFTGKNGVYHQMNVESRKKYTILEFKSLAESLNPPSPSHHYKKEMNENEVDLDKEIHYQKINRGPLEIKMSEKFVPGKTCAPNQEKWEELEKLYWKILPFKESYYGADLPGSLFPSSLEPWNISKLPGLLSNMKNKIPGVNTPYLYFGTWKATFAWHVEDMDLFSINYLHFGAPKHWYSIPPPERYRFEKLAQEYFAPEYRNCSQFLRHKTTVISPAILAKEHIPFNKIIQYPGEFMITFPYGYHQGFNYGFNCAEASNFAIPSWIDKGLRAEVCHCRNDNVTINVTSLLSENIKKENKRKHSHTDNTSTEPMKSSLSEDINSFSLPKIKFVMRKYCCLCPNLTGDYLRTDDEGKFVHVFCASMFPELSLSGGDMIVGIRSLSLEYFNKKCMICSQSVGAVLKCSEIDCFKYYHVSCAQARNLVYLTSRMIFCLVHDPARFLLKKRANLVRIYEQANRFKPGSRVLIDSGGAIVDAVILETSITRTACLVETTNTYLINNEVKPYKTWISFKSIQSKPDGSMEDSKLLRPTTTNAIRESAIKMSDIIDETEVDLE